MYTILNIINVYIHIYIYCCGRGAKVQKVPKLNKHSVKQRKTTAIGGNARFPSWTRR